MNHQAAIEIHGLEKRYGAFAAVRGLELAVERGSITGFLGPNGAGKSTTLRMLLGMVRPSAGTARVLGYAVDDPRGSLEIRRRVGFAGEDKRLYDYMTVAQILRFTRAFFPGWRGDLERQLLADFALPLGRGIRKLSKGMRTQLALLLAVCRGGELLILDEPSEGLDPLMTERLLELLVGLAAEGTTIFFSSHQIGEVEQIAEHVAIIDAGRLLLSAPVEQMRASYRRVDFVFPERVPLQLEAGLRMEGVERFSAQGRTASVFASRNVNAIVERGQALSATATEVTPLALREIFLESLKAARGADALA